MSEPMKDDTKRDDCLEQWRFVPMAKQTGTGTPSCADTTTFTDSPCATPSVSSMAQTETIGMAPSQTVRQEIPAGMQGAVELLSELRSNLHRQLQRLSGASAPAQMDDKEELYDVMLSHLKDLRKPGVVVTRPAEGAYQYKIIRVAGTWSTSCKVDFKIIAKAIDGLISTSDGADSLGKTHGAYSKAYLAVRGLYHKLWVTRTAATCAKDDCNQKFQELDSFVRLQQTGLEAYDVVVSERAEGFFHYGPPTCPELHVLLDTVGISKAIDDLAAMGLRDD